MAAYDSKVDSGFDHWLSAVMRLLISAALPTWGVALFILGVVTPNGYWIATGIVLVIVGMILFAGSTMMDLFLGPH